MSHRSRHAALPTITCLLACVAAGQRAEAVVSDLEVNNLTVDASALFKGALPASVSGTQVAIGTGQVVIGSGAANSLRVGPLNSTDNRTNTAASIQTSLATWANSDSTYADMFATDFNYYNNGTPNWTGAGVRYYGKTYPGTWPNTAIPLAKMALFTGQNAPATALAVNTPSPIYVLNGNGLAVTFQPNLSTVFEGVVPATPSATEVAIGGGQVYAHKIDIGGNPIGGVALGVTASSATSNFLGYQDTNTNGHTWLMGPGVGTGAVGDFGIYDQTIGTVKLELASSGNVGIGTTFPTGRLHVHYAVGQTSTGTLNLTSENGSIQFVGNALPGSANGLVQAGDKALIFSNGTIDTGRLVIAPWASSAPKGIVIDASGRVGIGMTTPTNALSVNYAIGQTSLGILNLTSENGSLQFLGNASSGAANGLVQAGDKALIFSNGAIDTGRLVIAPWASSAPKGIVIDASGRVGIGMTTPTNALSVAGVISAKEIKVTTSGADYVFEDGYRLRSLDEIARFVTSEKHLPEMMTAKAMQDGGMPVSEVVTQQLAKIEELTLYAIQQQKVIDAQQSAQTEQQKIIATLQSGLAEQQRLLAALTAKVESGHTAK